MKIPLLDLKAQYQKIKNQIDEAIQEVLDSQYFILGPKVEEFEKEVSNFLGVKHAVGVSSGTDALLVSLMALGIKPGDKIITTTYSFFATAEVIVRLGAKPVFVDIDPGTYNIDTKRVEKLLKVAKKGEYKAIIPVHLFGQCADMDTIMKIAESYGLKVIEDAAQALGAKYKKRYAGTMGDTGCFSFFPSKNLGGYGDGGMVVTNDSNLAEKISILRSHGSKDIYMHPAVGGNFRLDDIQAAILTVKLKYLGAWTKKRQENALLYDKLFKQYKLDEMVVLPYACQNRNHVYNQYVINVPKRDELKKFLGEKGISTGVYYPCPLHLQECFIFLGYKQGDFPEAENAAAKTLALPIYPELSAEQQEYIVSSIRDYFN